MPNSAALPDLTSRLQRLYPSFVQATRDAIGAVVDAHVAECPPVEIPADATPWDEGDVVLITYADQLRDEGQTPLAVLHDWLLAEDLDELVPAVHLLPFCPYSSDDGFSVIDYEAVDPESGTWDDITNLGDSFDLMFDFVMNHVSQHSEWFQKYLAGETPYDRFFIEADPATDLSAVVRPRSLPLLTPFETSRGTRHVWTTFSADQIDLNYGDPEVLVRLLDVLLGYVRRGARIVRLDAVAFLWKTPGTSSIHLPETHEVVKLMRDVLSAVAPQVLLLTETNVPHTENISYFGQGDEAHMVYQFSLPPLLLDAFISADATPLADWLENLSDPPSGTTYFNFTASHDGIGVRPLEGLVSDDRLQRLVEAVRARGGKVSTRRQADGTDTPYELNITYVDALAPEEPDTVLHARRFLATQAVMLAMRGMPALYFHSLVGTQNDLAGAETSGQPRRINRHKYTRDELFAAIAAPGSLQQMIFDGYRQLLDARLGQRVFHPDAPQRLVRTGTPTLFAFERTSRDGGERLLTIVNVTNESQSIDLATLVANSEKFAHELISGNSIESGTPLVLSPAQACWLLAE